MFAREVTATEIAQWRRELGLPDGPVALFVGRLVRAKGIETLLAAWRAVAHEGGASLCLIGDGPLRLDRARRQDGRVFFAGGFPRDRLSAAYAAADLVVVPSIETPRFLEPWGLVCNEAMSQARPVIATTAGAIPETVPPQAGLLVPPGDRLALARALRRVISEPALAAHLAAGARTAGALLPSWPQATAAWETAFDRLAGLPRPA